MNSTHGKCFNYNLFAISKHINNILLNKLIILYYEVMLILFDAKFCDIEVY